MEAWCVKCKAKREIKNPQEIIYKNSKGDKKAMIGTCVVCDTKVSRLLGKAQ